MSGLAASGGRSYSGPAILIATRNLKKAREMGEILASEHWMVLNLMDVAPDLEEPEETGCTYEENALIKARAAVRATGLVSLADDAGLEIDALGGQPGVYSRRFLGEDTSFPEKMERILELLRGVPGEQRGCRFRAAVAIVHPDGEEHVCYGVCEGRIGHAMRGQYGFGYDPIFFLPTLGKHMAELPPAEKHAISHRGQALRAARTVLQDWLRAGRLSPGSPAGPR